MASASTDVSKANGTNPAGLRERFRADFAFTKQLAPDEDGHGVTIAGYASTWVQDRDGEFVDPKAFDGSLDKYLAKNPILLWQHNPDWPIGKVIGATVDKNGLWIQAFVPEPEERGADWEWTAYSKIKKGIVKTFSIGGFFDRQTKGGKPMISAVELFEVSVVSIPSNPDSIFEAAAKALSHDAPLRITEKAMSQMEQLLGFKDVTDPELVPMDAGARESHYRDLSQIFTGVHGTEPPPLGAWSQVLEARSKGASVVTVAEAASALAKALYVPQAKGGAALSSANRMKLQHAIDMHGEAMKGYQDSMAIHVSAAQNIASVLGHDIVTPWGDHGPLPDNPIGAPPPVAPQGGTARAAEAEVKTPEVESDRKEPTTQNEESDDVTSR